MPDAVLRRADPYDLDAIASLERACFEPERRSSRVVLRRSLRSRRQEVWVAEADGRVVGGLVLWLFPRTVRVYGVAIHPDVQGRGLGRRLMEVAEREATGRGARVVLEADADRAELVRWYEGQGYRRVVRKPDFYAPGRDAWRMEKRMEERSLPSGKAK